MLIYNVTVKIENNVQDEWLTWMKSVHIPDVMKTGLFTENRMLKILEDDDPEATGYAIQYSCKSLADFEKYNSEFAPALRDEHANRYKNKFVAFRTLLEVI